LFLLHLSVCFVALWFILHLTVAIIILCIHGMCEVLHKSFRICHLEPELLAATRCSCISILWVSLVSFAAITLCVASQWAFIVIVAYFVMIQSENFWIHPRINFINCTDMAALRNIRWAEHYRLSLWCLALLCLVHMWEVCNLY
jgi:hypothetical protein